MKAPPLAGTRTATDTISLPLLRFPFAFLALLTCVIVPGASASGAPEQRAFGPIQPRLSPDGQQIALSWQGAICRMPASDGALTVLTRRERFCRPVAMDQRRRWLAPQIARVGARARQASLSSRRQASPRPPQQGGRA